MRLLVVRFRRRARFLDVLAKQLASDVVGKKSRGLNNRKAIRLVVSSNTGAGDGSFLADCLGEPQPPSGLALSVIVVVKQFENGVTGEGQKGVAIENAGLGLEEGVGAEAVLVDFEHKFAGTAIGSERARRQARVHDRIEAVKTKRERVRLNTTSLGP